MTKTVFAFLVPFCANFQTTISPSPAPHRSSSPPPPSKLDCPPATTSLLLASPPARETLAPDPLRHTTAPHYPQIHPRELISDPPMRVPVIFPVLLLALTAAASEAEAAATLSSRMVHRLSDEARLEAGPRGEWWPQRGSGEYYRALVRSDLQRQKRRLGGKYELLSLSKGGSIFSSGNDLGWCAAFPAPHLLFIFYTGDSVAVLS